MFAFFNFLKFFLFFIVSLYACGEDDIGKREPINLKIILENHTKEDEKEELKPIDSEEQPTDSDSKEEADPNLEQKEDTPTTVPDSDSEETKTKNPPKPPETPDANDVVETPPQPIIDNEAPSAHNFYFKDITNTELTLYFDDAIDNITPSHLLEYQIIQSEKLEEIDSIEKVQTSLSQKENNISSIQILKTWSKDKEIKLMNIEPYKSFAYAVMVRDEKGNTALFPPKRRATGKMIYHTKKTYFGNLGGTTGADTLCSTDAPENIDKTASLKAIIAGPSRQACQKKTCQLSDNLNWPLSPETPYINEKAEFIGSTNNAAIFEFPLIGKISPLLLTENALFWSGLTETWQTSIHHCKDWNSSSGLGSVGNFHLKTSSLLRIYSEFCAQETRYLLCAESN